MPAQQRPAASDSPTLGEIGRLLEALRGETQAFRNEVNARFDEIAGTYVRRDVYDAEARANASYVKGLEERVVTLEGNQAWIARIIIGAVVMAILGGLFAATKLVGA